MLALCSAMAVLVGCMMQSGSPPNHEPSDRPEVAAWTPRTPLSARVDMPEEAKFAERAMLLEVSAIHLGIADPPDVALVRWTRLEETGSAIASCLTQQGFPASVTADGFGVMQRDRVPDDQQSALTLATYICEAQYTRDPRYGLPFTAEQRGLLYDYLVEFYVPCVRRLGYAVGDQPSKQVYVASEPLDAWNPAADVPWPTDRNEQDRLLVTCPQYPPSELLYGS